MCYNKSVQLPISSDQLRTILIAEGLVTPEVFDRLLEEAQRKGQSIIDVLVANHIAESGYLDDVIAKALGVPRIRLAASTIDKEVLRLLPEAMARDRQVVLFHREEDGTYDVAMVNPSDLETIEFLTERLKARVKPFLANAEDLNQGFSVYGYEGGQDFQKIIEENIRASLQNKTGTAAEAASQLPVVGIVDNILSYAMA